MRRSLFSILKDKKELRNDINKQIDSLEEEGFDAVQDMNAAGTSKREISKEKARGKKLKSLGIRLKNIDKTINKITEDLKDKTKPTESKKTKLKDLSGRGRRISGGGGMMTTFKKGKSLIEKMKDL